MDECDDLVAVVVADVEYRVQFATAALVEEICLNDDRCIVIDDDDDGPV